MISIELARRLRDAGLRWQPDDGDRFVIPDRNLDNRVFSISEMTVDVRGVPGGPLITFNGTVEWALDSVMQREVIWLPAESQLRELLGDTFLRLERAVDTFACQIMIAGRTRTFEHPDAAEAYGLALLERLATQGATPAVAW
jgi:hypothetical protein